jgi:acetyl-CoA carboxylase biotin carboxyl carrier protein
MDFEDIERILELVRQHDLAEFELEREGLKLRVRKASAGFPQASLIHPPPLTPLVVMPQAAAPSGVGVPSGPAPGPAAADEAEVELAVVKSPIVGTFYRSSEPGASPFVEVGQQVKKDQVLCIIEAMKLMNEITSEYEGEITSVYVENGMPVQYGERLFAIRTA